MVARASFGVGPLMMADGRQLHGCFRGWCMQGLSFPGLVHSHLAWIRILQHWW